MSTLNHLQREAPFDHNLKLPTNWIRTSIYIYSHIYMKFTFLVFLKISAGCINSTRNEYGYISKSICVG